MTTNTSNYRLPQTNKFSSLKFSLCSTLSLNYKTEIDAFLVYSTNIRCNYYKMLPEMLHILINKPEFDTLGSHLNNKFTEIVKKPQQHCYVFQFIF